MTLAQRVADALEALEEARLRAQDIHLALLTQRDRQLTTAELVALLDAATEVGR